MNALKQYRGILTLLIFVIVVISVNILCSCARNATVDEPLTPRLNHDSIINLTMPYDTQGERARLVELLEDFSFSAETNELEYYFYARENTWQMLYTAYSGGTMADLVQVDNTMLIPFQKLGLLHDMSAYWEGSGATDTIYTKLREAVMIDGVPYGVPMTANTYALWLNMDILGTYKQNPPQSWDELIGIAVELDREPADALAIAAAPGTPFSETLLQMIQSNGAEIRNLKSDESLDMLQMIRDMVDQRLLSRDCVNWNRQDLVSKFATRQVAMIITDSSQLPELQQYDVDFAWMISPLPTDLSKQHKIRGESIALLADEMTDNMSELLDFMLSPDAIQYRAEQFGSIPVCYDIDSSVFAIQHSQSVFKESFYQAEPVQSFVLWQNISTAIEDAGIDLLSSERAVDDIAQDLHSRVNTYIIDSN